jgi:hypothetical protein
MMGMMGGVMKGNPIQSFLDIMNDSENDDSSDSGNPLDTNGDGIVAAEEALAGIKKLIQEYQNQMTSIFKQDSGNESQLNILA